jgi:flagellar hook-basal body complex protein FliE
VTLPIGAIGAALPTSSLAGLSGSASSALAASESAVGASQAGLGGSGGQTAGSSAITGVSTAGGASGIGGVQAPTGLEGATTGVEGSTAGTEGGFGEALTHAISSLEQTQLSSDGAAQALATGTAGNPEGAVVTVEDAQLAMQLASQIRTKATEAVQQIFQTQV